MYNTTKKSDMRHFLKKVQEIVPLWICVYKKQSGAYAPLL